MNKLYFTYFKDHCWHLSEETDITMPTAKRLFAQYKEETVDTAVDRNTQSLVCGHF